ncbi:MAG: PcfB family protein [Lachnospiraceae bacterium]|nr:PcfB family protein [Lachnospiraceae bacterium]
MQEELNEKTIALCFKGGKLTAGIFKAGVTHYLSEKDKKKQAQRMMGKSTKNGKQSLKRMMETGSELTNIEITDSNIKSFEKVARKYGIDYSLKKDKSKDPPHYLVFFRAKDEDVMEAAFREYTGESLGKEKRPSIRQRLTKAKERLAKHRQQERTRQKDRGQSL